MKKASIKKSDDGVYMIIDGKGTDIVPPGNAALYYHANFNNGTHGNILVIPKGVSLDEEELMSYGFDVGQTNGVSSVVNKTDNEVSLISGQYLDGEVLAVPANTNISSLTNYPLGTGTWNDSTRSFVGNHVSEVTLRLYLESNISISQDETWYIYLKVSNESDVPVNSLSIQAESSDVKVMGIGDYEPTMDVPAHSEVSGRIPLLGIAEGVATLTCRIYTPENIVNNGDNVEYTSVTVTAPRELSVTQSLMAHWQIEWDKPEWMYSYHLVMSSESTAVNSWRLSFLLPDGAEVSPSWLETNSNWLSLNQSLSVNGTVVLDSTEGHVISPDTDLPLDIQIIYLGEDESYNTLRNLYVLQLS